MQPADEAQREHSRTSNSRLNSSQNMMTTISEGEPWTITSKPKAYAFLWERCTKGMKNKIESHTNYATIQQDPIELLKAIKEHALNYQEQCYKHLIILDATVALLNTKQQDNESLQDYTK